MKKQILVLLFFIYVMNAPAMQLPNAAWQSTQELQEIIDELLPEEGKIQTRSLLRDPLKIQQDKEEEAGFLADIKELIEQGADINATNEDGITILSVASLIGFSDTVKYLLSKNANPNIPSHLPPLLNAVQWGYKDMVKLLLDAGAEVDKQAQDGRYALFVALDNEDYDMADLLLSHGANPLLTDDRGESALDAAKTAIDPKAIELFKRRLQ